MCHLLSKVTSFISSALRSTKSVVLALVLILTSSFALTAQASVVYDFEDSSVDYPSYGGVTASYTTLDDAGVNRSMLKLVNGEGAEWWSGVTIAAEYVDTDFLGDGTAPATMRVYAEQDGNLNLELEANGQPAVVVNLAVTQGWNDLSFDFSGADAAVNWHKIQIRPDALGQASNAVETTYYIDDVAFPGATIVAAPEVAAPASPVPTDAADSVLSIFSDAYTDLEGTNFNPGWGQATQVTVADGVITYAGLNYQGTEFTPSDVSGYGYIHLDFFTNDATDLQFTIISPGKENLISLTDQIVLGQWVSVEIPLTDYIADLTSVFQFKVVGNGNVVLDNLYFGGVAAPVDPTTKVNVTFQVNMDGVDTANGVSVMGGAVFGQAGLAMSDDDGDNVWTVTTELDINTTVAFKYRNTTALTWGGQEPVSGDCTFGQWNDRQVVVAEEDITLDVVAFGSCSDQSGQVPDNSDGDTTSPSEVTAYCATQITHFLIPAETASAVYLTVERIDANNVDVSVSSADADPVDTLVIGAQDDPAGVSPVALDNGTATIRLTYNAGAPDSTKFEVLWSKESFEGNWMVRVADWSAAIDTANTCSGTSTPTAPVVDTTVSFTATLPAGTASARLHSEAFGWDVNHPDGVATDNGDGTWTATIPAPWAANTNYKWYADGAEENLKDDVDAGYCANDGLNSGDWGANRLYSGSGDVAGQVFGECSDTPDASDAPDLVATIMNLVFDFEDSAVEYPAYGGVAASYATQDDAGVARNMLKLVNGAGSAWWSGVTLAVLPAGNDFRGDGLAAATMRVYAEQDGNLNLELEADGQPPAVVNLAVTQGWNDLSFDFSGASDAVNWHKIQVRPDALGEVSNATETTYYIDDVTFPNASILDSDSDGASDLVDDLPNDPTETVDSDGDGVGDNADELPNDPAYTSQAEYDAAQAMPDAPTPTDAADSVLSIFSDAYTDLADTDFNPNWGQATQVVVADGVITYTGLNYQGTQFTNSDVSAYGYVNLDFFTTNATDLQFTIISPAQEKLFGLADQIVLNQWNSVQIPLTNFDNVDLTDVFQFKVVGNGTVVLDNLYFGGTAPAPLDSDGDGVIDSEDFAPNDPNVQVAPITKYCATEVTHFNIDNHPGAILLTVENSGADSITVTASSTDGNAMDVLDINTIDGGGTAAGATFTDGVATNVISWAEGTMPATTSFTMLWSDDTSDGSQMLNNGFGTGDPANGLGYIDTADTCPVATSVVTFSVDMTGVELGGDVPTLNGTFNDWCGDCAPMSDDDGDNVWTIDVDLADGPYDYQFTLGNWVVEESVPLECGTDYQDQDTGETKANRNVLVSGSDKTLDTVVWSGCAIDSTKSLVTFSVDMTDVDLLGEVPTVNGAFNAWCGECAPMSDEDGDNIWTTELALDAGEWDYKFVLGNWVAEETVSAACGTPRTDANEVTVVNRTVTVEEATDLVLDVTPWSDCPETGYTPADGFLFIEAFSGAEIDGSVFTFPSSADSWAGFANMNTTLYPITLAEDNVITFTGSVPAGGDAVVRFRFEANPYPHTEPSFNTETVTVSGAEEATYSINVPSQGANSFNSFIMYLDTRDVDVSVTNIALAPPVPTSVVTFSVDMTGVELGGDVPTLNGTFNDWCGDCAPMSDDDGDNIWTIDVDLADGPYDYQFTLGNWVQEETVPLECGTDYLDQDTGETKANRNVLVSGSDKTLDTVVWSGCAIDSTKSLVTFTVDMTDVDLLGEVPTVNGAFNAWCGECAPMSDEDGDNIWTTELALDAGEWDYKFVLGNWVAEETVSAACGTPRTDANEVTVVNRTVTVEEATDLVLDVTPWSDCPETGYTPADGFLFIEAFSGAEIDGSVFTFPSSADSWAGFANMNTTLYPITLAEDNVITFTGSVPAGGDAVVRFRFEANPYPHTEPSFNTETVTVSGAEEATYSINVPSQGANTFNSFIMYLDTRDVDVSVTNIAINAAATGPVDSDNDGVNDDQDAFPNDASETADSDNDGVGDNADAFPNDASETADSDNDGVGDNADYAPNDPAVTEAPPQPDQLVSVKGNPSASVGGSVDVVIEYNVSDNDATLSGLGVSVHYDSSSLTFTGFADVLAADNISSDGPFNDDQDLDGNPATDKYVSGAWASLFSNWPGALPIELLTLSFDVADPVTGDSTPIGFSSVSNAAGYDFVPTAYDMPFSSGSWDFDKDGKADALTDGLMLLRYTFNLRGDALTAGAISSDSTLSAAEVEANVADASTSFADIDGSGNVDALTDGLLLLRYLFNLRGDALIAGAIAGGAERSSAADVEAYIISLMP